MEKKIKYFSQSPHSNCILIQRYISKEIKLVINLSINCCRHSEIDVLKNKIISALIEMKLRVLKYYIELFSNIKLIGLGLLRLEIY